MTEETLFSNEIYPVWTVIFCICMEDEEEQFGMEFGSSSVTAQNAELAARFVREKVFNTLEQEGDMENLVDFQIAGVVLGFHETQHIELED